MMLKKIVGYGFLLMVLLALPLFSQEKPDKTKLKGEGLLNSLQNKNYALIKTTKGDVLIRLFAEDTPANVWLFKGLASGAYGWVNLDGNVQNDRYYDGQRIHEVIKNRWFLFASSMGANYHWAGYDVQDEIFKRGKELKDSTVINNDYYAGLVFSNYLLRAHDEDNFKKAPKLKAFYDAVLDKKNYKPLYGKTIGSFKALSGYDTPLYERVRIREPQKGDLFLFNIGVDTAYGVAGIYTGNVTLPKDKEYTVIGTVVEGMNVIEQINNMDRKKDNIKILTVTFQEEPSISKESTKNKKTKKR